jgi:hypothetical protein
MAKGIKMRSARDRLGNPYGIEALQRLRDAGHAVPQLVCDDPTCVQSVRFVPRHQKNLAGRSEPVDVPAYIGLSSGSEHVAGCRYDAKKKFTVIADQSDPEFLFALDDGKRELRLLALHNGLRKPGLSGAAAVAGAGRPSSAATTSEVLASERQLDSYLRTTMDIVILRAMCESDALLASELTLRMGSKRIPWKQFFFEADRFDEAWQIVRDSEGAAHQIALAAEVRGHHSPGPGAKYTSSFLNCVPLIHKTSDPLWQHTFEVTVAHADGTWLSSFPIGSEIVMFGLWSAAAVTERTVPDRYDKTRKLTYVTHKLTLYPKFKKQVAAVP